jgi:hypothetical protein
MSINFGEFLSSAHGNFEQQNGVLESCTIIINYIIIIIIIIVKVLQRYRDNTIFEDILRKPV